VTDYRYIYNYSANLKADFFIRKLGHCTAMVIRNIHDIETDGIMIILKDPYRRMKRVRGIIFIRLGRVE
jgi:hypothetical protein